MRLLLDYTNAATGGRADAALTLRIPPRLPRVRANATVLRAGANETVPIELEAPPRSHVRTFCAPNYQWIDLDIH